MKHILLRFIKFRKEYLDKEEENYIAECKRLGGRFSVTTTPDEVILEKFYLQTPNPMVELRKNYPHLQAMECLIRALFHDGWINETDEVKRFPRGGAPVWVKEAITLLKLEYEKNE